MHRPRPRTVRSRESHSAAQCAPSDTAKRANGNVECRDAASRAANRWTESFSIPGYSAYEANARTLDQFGTGMRPPKLVVFHTSGDATRSPAIRAAMTRAVQANPGARTSSFYSTGSTAYVSKDRHTTFLQIYPPGEATFDRPSGAATTRLAAATGLAGDITVHVTGHDPLEEASKNGSGGGSRRSRI